MKYVMIKIFLLKQYKGVRIMMGNLKDNRKIIEKDFFKQFDNYEQLELYISNLTLNLNFMRSKVFVNYISNDIIVENFFNDFNLSKHNNLKEKLNEIYPNYNLKYIINNDEILLRSKQKQFCIVMKPINFINKISEITSSIRVNKKVHGIDVVMLQQHLNRNLQYFYKKQILLIQKDCSFWRFYKIIYGKIIDYIVINENEETFVQIEKSLLDECNNRFDEIIVDTDYRIYMNITEKIKYQNIIYIDYITRLKNLDERKIIYAK